MERRNHTVWGGKKHVCIIYYILSVTTLEMFLTLRCLTEPKRKPERISISTEERRDRISPVCFHKKCGPYSWDSQYLPHLLTTTFLISISRNNLFLLLLQGFLIINTLSPQQVRTYLPTSKFTLPFRAFHSYLVGFEVSVDYLLWVFFPYMYHSIVSMLYCAVVSLLICSQRYS